MKTKTNKGFTLMEMLVVVLIIGILAGIALPKYQMAVTKAKVASILPLMRRWKDALAEYKLQHGSYEDLYYKTAGATLGVSWPSDWSNGNANCSDSLECCSDYWDGCCFANEEHSGAVYCGHNNSFTIAMYQSDDQWYEDLRGMITCVALNSEGHKICKALGGKLVDGYEEEYQI